MTTSLFRVPALALALSLVTLTACDKEKAADGEAKSDDEAKSDGEAKAADDKAASDKADDKKAADAGEASKQADAAQPEGGGEEAPPPAPAPAASGGDGVAYFAINNRGIAKLDANGWSLLVDDKRVYFSKMFLGADGKVYVVDFEGVKKIEGSSLVQAAKFDYSTFSGGSHVATSKDGATFFGAAYNKYGTFSAGKWTSAELNTIDAELDSLLGVATAGDGTVWLSGSKSIHFNKGNAGTWAKLDISSLGERPFFTHLSSSPTGDVFVTSGQHLIKLTPEKPEKIEYKVEAKSWASYNADLAYNAEGHVLAASTTCDLVRLDPANPGEQWTASKKDFNCLTLQAVALDSQNRAWVSSREGLSVIGPEKSATEYPNSTVMELVGSYVSDIVVLGKGPTLPEVGPLHTGGVTGKVLVEGSPVANSKIEMCTTPSYGGSQPCYDAKVKFAGTTNDKGEFTFNDVPIANYTVVVEIGGKWQMSALSNVATEMKEGQIYDAGAVKFKAL